MIKDLQILNFRENKIIIFSVTAFLSIYVFSSIGMYDPEGIEVLQGMLDLMPEAMMKLMGFDNLGGDLTSYLINYMYGFLMIIFPLIYTIMVGNKLVSKHTDSGSMIYLLTMPYSRRKIIFNQALFFSFGLLFIIGVNVLTMILFSEALFPGMLEIGKLLAINLVTFGVHLILAAVTFLFSCLLSDSQKTIGFSSVVLFASVVTYMVSSLGDATEFLKYFSVFSFINVSYILEGGGNGILTGIILILIGLAMFAGSIELFNRKSIII